MSTTLASAVRHQLPPVIAEPVIEMHDLTKRYGRTVIHEHLNLDMRHGEIVALIGGSGSGRLRWCGRFSGWKRRRPAPFACSARNGRGWTTKPPR